MNVKSVAVGAVVMVVAGLCFQASAEPNVAVVAGAWGDDSTWSLGHKPVQGEEVEVVADVLLDEATPRLASFSIADATLSFTNWTSCLNADSVTLSSGARFTIVGGAFESEADASRVNVSCGDFTLGEGATIDVSGKGYAGTPASQYGYAAGFGPGGGPYGKFGGGGAAHGGNGGQSHNDLGWITSAALAYDDPFAPALPGSGGSGSWFGPGGDGGGAVRISATGAVSLYGAILANAGAGSAGGGSGGSVYISGCTVAASESARIEAKGGSVTGDDGAGAGGLVMIEFDSAAQSTIGAPHVGIDVSRGTGGRGVSDATAALPGHGRINFSDFAFVDSARMPYGGILAVTNHVVELDSLKMSGAWLEMVDTGAVLRVTGVAEISGADSRVVIPQDGSFECGSLSLADGASVEATAVVTNQSVTPHGAVILVDGLLEVGDGAAILVRRSSDGTDGAAALIEAGSLIVDECGSIDATAQGYAGGLGQAYVGEWGPAYGPGAGGYGKFGAGGGGHGGIGGTGRGDGYRGAPGAAYDDPSAPMQPGSGGAGTWGAGCGASGGGALRIVVRGLATVDGSISADGESSTTGGGNGAGGSVYLTCAALAGSGTISARGGDASQGSASGAGGGGLVTVEFDAESQAQSGKFSVCLDASAGTGGPADCPAAGEGIVTIPDPAFLDGSRLLLGGILPITNEVWSADSLNLLGGTISYEATGAVLSVAGDLVITGAHARIAMANGGTIRCGALSLVDGGALDIDAALADGSDAAYGALVSVAGDTLIGEGSWIMPNNASCATNGATIRIETVNLVIEEGGGIDASGMGYSGGTWTGSDCYYQQFADGSVLNGYGPGAGAYGKFGGCGASHGGVGGNSFNDYGMFTKPVPAYDSAEDPVLPGSGGGSSWYAIGTAGGGAIDLAVANNATLNGAILADGADNAGSGAGSGGSIRLVCKRLYGASTAVFSARGGNAPLYCTATNGSGGGAGGRVSISARIDELTGLEPGLYENYDPEVDAPACAIDLAGGEGAATPREIGEGETAFYELYTESTAGSLFIRRIAPEGTLFLLR